MKKLNLLCFLLFSFVLQATDIIPNGNFENWSSTTYSLPENYPYSSNLQSHYDETPFNLTKTTDFYHGQFAVKLSTISTEYGSSMCYFINSDPGEGDMSTWKNGFEYNQMPTGIRGYYKYNVASADSALIMIVFRKSGSSIGNYVFKIGGVKNEYSLFDFTLNPALSQTPDSVIFGAVSSDFSANDGGVVGSTLYLDSVSFTGVVSQPTLMNGDFENWTDYTTPITLDAWNPNDKRMDGITRTTAAKDGDFAIELTSYLGQEKDINNNIIERTQPGYITTGYWSNSCNCNLGGTPFSNRIDTLTFWYKYIPSSTDLAEVSIDFKKNGTNFDWRMVSLDAATEYRYIELPFEVGQAPDSVILNIISSSWNNTNLAFIGSKLVIDKMMFKSGIVYTGLNETTDKNFVDIYPSASNGIFTIKNPENTPLMIEIYNSAGIKISDISGVNLNINLLNKPGGIYFAKINLLQKTIIKKLIKL
ncbi:MAG: T9SS type A sorting domain-containing protein [Paludibacter sp.]|nr:T9SS type A sorting domain-containing protein [Paludibacter sp.]